MAWEQQTGRNFRTLPALLVAGSIGLPYHAVGQGILASYVQPGVPFKIGAEQIDLTVDLPCFEEPSARERKGRDAHADRHITRSEGEAYLNQYAPEMVKQGKLKIAGHEVPLIPLYDPEIEPASGRTMALKRYRGDYERFIPVQVSLREAADVKTRCGGQRGQSQDSTTQTCNSRNSHRCPFFLLHLRTVAFIGPSQSRAADAKSLAPNRAVEFAKWLARLAEIEQWVAVARNPQQEVRSRGIVDHKQLVHQGEALLVRVARARKLYEALRATAKHERVAGRARDC